MTTTLTSSLVQLNQGFGAAISCVVTGGSSPAGTLTCLGSVDGVNFEALEDSSGSPIALTVSGDGTYLFDVIQTSCQYLQVTYVPVSGSGTLNATSFYKGF